MPAHGAEDITTRIAQLDGRTLVGGRWPLPGIVRMPRGQSFLRVRGLARRGAAEELNLITQAVIGLHGMGGPFCLIALGTNQEFLLGLLHGDPSVVGNLLRGILPGTELEVAAPTPAVLAALGALRHGAIVVGVPAHPEVGSLMATGQEAGHSPADPGDGPSPAARASLLDTLAGGMSAQSWGLWVQAVPVPDQQVAASVERLAEEIRLASGALMQRHTIDEDNRLAKHYVELLEGTLKRAEVGRCVGMWQVGTYILADDPARLGLAAALTRAALGGRGAGPPHLATLPCEGATEFSLDATACPTLLTSIELAAIVRPPAHETSGFGRRRHAKFDVATHAAIASSPRPGLAASPTREGITRSVAVGKIVERGEVGTHWLEMPLDDLARHGLIVGMTGSGKTNTVLYLLQQLWADHHVPFLVIEPVKAAYRSLLELPEFADLLVFTPGDDRTSPFRWNPFEVPAGGLIQAHIDHLKSVFAASFVLYPPMPHVLERSLHEVYEDRGWNLEANSNTRGEGDPRAFPTLTDLHEKVGEVVERLGYDTRLTMDVQAGLRARIQSLRIGAKGAMLDVRASFPFADLVRRPVVIELRQIASDEEKAFIIGLILTRLQEHYDVLSRRGDAPATAHLAHVTVLEEAHRLLRSGRAGSAGPDSADPRQHAVETFTNMLAEIRAYGEGLLVVDQIPEKLAPEVIRNTNLKLVHRLASARDRDLVGEAMLLEKEQADFVATLRPGCAAASMDGADGPYLLAVPEMRALCPAMESEPSDNRIAAMMMSRFGAQVAPLLLPLAACGDCPHLGQEGLGPVRNVAGAPRFRDAVAGFLLALISSPDAARRSLETLGEVARQILPPLTVARVVAVAACAFVHEALRQLEVRARRDFWPFIEVARLESDLAQLGTCWRNFVGAVEAVGPAADTAGSGGAARSGRPDAKPTLLVALAELRADLLRLTSREMGPYSGCRYCRQICHLREIGERIGRDDGTVSHGLQVLGTDDQGGGAHARLAEFCRLKAGAWGPLTSPALVRDLALCLAVHLAQEVDFAEVGELALARAVRDLS